MRRGDVEAALRAGVRIINLSAPVSRLHVAAKFGGSRSALLDAMGAIIGFARSEGLEVALGGEDSSRASAEELLPVLACAEELGASRFRYADTLGVLDPFTTAERIAELVQMTALPVEFHGHDDLGLATANTLAALRGGARHVSVTVLGLGERAGNAPLEEVALAAGRLELGHCAIRAEQLQTLADIVARAANRPVPPAKAIVGRDVFTHESGIHVAGLLKDAATYEALPPSTLGRAHQIVLGRHSGARAVVHVLDRLGLPSDPELVARLLPEVHAHAVRAKAALNDHDVRRLVRKAARGIHTERAVLALAGAGL